MGRAVRQYCFYGISNNSNTQGLTMNNLISGSIFFNESTLGPIVQLGIQALPGTRFYLNSSITPVIIGSSGIYELNLRSEAQITMLSFERASLERISDTPSAVLIVDAIYEVEG